MGCRRIERVHGPRGSTRYREFDPTPELAAHPHAEISEILPSDCRGFGYAY